MSAPTAVKYEMTHAAGSGLLPDTSVPTYLSRYRKSPSARVAPLHGGPARAASPRFEAGPTTHAARWMCKRGNRRWGFSLAVLAALGYAGGAWFFYEVNHMVTWVLVVLFAYNAAKFTLVAGWLALVGFGSLMRVALNTRPRRAR